MDGGLVFPSIDIQPSKGFTWPCQLEAHQGKPHRSYHLRWETLDRGVLGTPVASRYGTVCWAWNPLKKRKSTRSWLVSTPPTWQKGNGTRKTFVTAPKFNRKSDKSFESSSSWQVILRSHLWTLELLAATHIFTEKTDWNPMISPKSSSAHPWI